MLANAATEKVGSHPGLYRRRPRIGWALLVAYTVFLVYGVPALGVAGGTTRILIQELQDPGWLVRRMSGFALTTGRDFLCFFPVGFFAARLTLRGRACPRSPISLPALAAASGLTLVAYTLRIIGTGHWATIVGLIFPLFGGLLGTWAGTTWLRGWGARWRFLPKFALLALLVVLGLGVGASLVLERTPWSLESGGATALEKRRLVRLVRNRGSVSLKEGQTHTLRLTEHDVNVLLSWGLSLQGPRRQAMVHTDHDSISFWMSVAVPLGQGRSRYLNLGAAGGAAIKDGVLELRLHRCQIGSAEAPSWLLHSLGFLAASLLNQDRRSRPFLEAIPNMAIEPNGIEFTYRPLALPVEFRERFLGPAVRNEGLLASTRTQVDRLLPLFAAGPVPDLQPSFNLCLKTAFALARDRSAERSPLVENQAALFALGILLGHPAIEGLVGPIVADHDFDAAQEVLGRVLLHGHPDWTRHFCVSAVITMLSDQAFRDAIGLLKEELDTDTGGSGFSFADLLMDRAGATFALAATRDEATARAMQDRLAHGFRVDDVCPPAEDLPEGVSAAELQSRYGGINGEKYRGLLEEIQRRVAACAAYR